MNGVSPGRKHFFNFLATLGSRYFNNLPLICLRPEAAAGSRFAPPNGVVGFTLL